MSQLLGLPATFSQSNQADSRRASCGDSAAKDNPVHVLLVEDNEDEAVLVDTLLRDAGDFRLRWAGNLAAGMNQIAAGGVDVVLLDLGLPDGKGPESFYCMSRAAGDIPIVVLTADSSRQTEAAVRRNGAQEFLAKQNIGTQELVRSILQATQGKAERIYKSETRRGRIIGFVGSKGGVGTTSLVLNVAGAMSALKYHAIAVELPDVPSGFALHLAKPFARPLHRWSDLSLDRINRDTICEHLVRMPFGADILFGPQSADPRPDGPRGLMEEVLRSAAPQSEFVLVDIGASPLPSSWEALGVCDFIVVVADREPTSVQAARRWLQWFRLKGMGTEAVGTIVVNRSGLPTNTSMRQVAQEIGCPLVGVIPSAGEHMASASTRHEILLRWKPDNLSSVSLMDTAVRLSAQHVQPIAH